MHGYYIYYNCMLDIKVDTEEFVDKQGIIHRKGFYSFLRAWYQKDPMGYESSRVSKIII